jgi:hypothetical protein
MRIESKNRAKVLKTCLLFRKEGCVKFSQGVVAAKGWLLQRLLFLRVSKFICTRMLERWLEGIARVSITPPSIASGFESETPFRDFFWECGTGV